MVDWEALHRQTDEPEKKSRGPKTCFEAAIHLLSRREHAPAELAQKLRERGFEPREVREEIQRLEAQDYLSAERYVRARLRDGLRRGWGLARIQAEVGKWGLEVSETLREEETQSLGWNQTEALRELAEWKWERLCPRADLSDRSSREKVKAKLVRFLVSRGYPAGQSFAVAADLIRGED
jgi:regulatory protein